MPLPIGLLIVGAAALLAGGVGVAKGIEAKNRFDEADDINEDATEIYDKATESLKRCRRATQAALEELGRQKVSLVRDSMMPFVKAFSRIKHVDYDEMRIFKKSARMVKLRIEIKSFFQKFVKCLFEWKILPSAPAALSGPAHWRAWRLMARSA